MFRYFSRDQSAGPTNISTLRAKQNKMTQHDKLYISADACIHLLEMIYEAHLGREIVEQKGREWEKRRRREGIECIRGQEGARGGSDGVKWRGEERRGGCWEQKRRGGSAVRQL